MKRYGILWIIGCALVSATFVAGADLQTFDGATLLAAPGNDGDSFTVRFGDRQQVIRLYYVDCPETHAGTESDARRLREQTRYFGIESPTITRDYGRQAASFAAEQLAAPFTVHTAFANALGRSAGGRVYAFVTTAAGEDLGIVLVRSGLARSHGVGRRSPDGTPRDEMKAHLSDLETAAVHQRIGLWEQTDPERLADLRAEQRREKNELRELTATVEGRGTASAPINVNTASRKQLTTLPGIGPVIADRIIAGRPYGKATDIVRVKGIGPKTFERLAPHLVVGD